MNDIYLFRMAPDGTVHLIIRFGDRGYDRNGRFDADNDGTPIEGGDDHNATRSRASSPSRTSHYGPNGARVGAAAPDRVTDDNVEAVLSVDFDARGGRARSARARQ